jgi:hypothetical protein
MRPEPPPVEDSAAIADKRDPDPVLRPITWFVVAFALILAGIAVFFLSFVVANRTLLSLALWLIAAGNMLGGLGFAMASVQLLIWIRPGRPQFSLRSLIIAGVVFACFCSVGATWGWFVVGYATAGALQLLAPVVVILASRRRPTLLQGGCTGVIVAVVASFGLWALCGATIGAPIIMRGWAPPNLDTAFRAPVSLLFIIAGTGVWPYYAAIVAVGALEGVICSKFHWRLREVLRRKPLAASVESK